MRRTHPVDAFGRAPGASGRRRPFGLLAFAALFTVAPSPLACSGKVAGGDAGANNPPPSCAATCARLVSTSCPGSYTTQADCEAQCEQALAAAQQKSCGPEFDDVLSCAETVTLRCLNGQLDPSTCQDQEMALDKCANPPPHGCEAIPVAAGTTSCSSPGAPPGASSTTICSDGKGDTWTATCTGSTCTCGYGGQTYCTCQTGGAGACCPGVF